MSAAPAPMYPSISTGLLLAEEISHRVVNEYAVAIAVLNAEARRTQDGRARSTLTRTALRLHDLAEAHRALQPPSASGELSLQEHLERLCRALASATLQARGVGLTLVQADITLPADRCWKVGLIIAELITNAVRHGLRDVGGQILIEVERSDGYILCEVSDDGGGAAEAEPGRGRLLLERLAADLDGDITWRFGPDGVTARLILPA